MIRDLEKSPKRRSRANAKWVVVAAAARDEGHYRTFPTSRATHKFGRRNRSCCCCSSWCRWCAELFQTIISCRLCYVAIKTYTVFCQQLCTATSTVLLRLLLLLHLPQPPPVAPSAEREAAQELATRSLRLVLHSHTAAAAQSDRASEPASQQNTRRPLSGSSSRRTRTMRKEPGKRTRIRIRCVRIIYHRQMLSSGAMSWLLHIHPSLSSGAMKR